MCGRQFFARRSMDGVRSLRFLRPRRFSIISTRLETAVGELGQTWNQLREVYNFWRPAIEIAGLIADNTAGPTRVRSWFEAVDSLEETIMDIFTRLQRIHGQAQGFSDMSLQSRFKLAKDVFKTIKLAKKSMTIIRGYLADGNNAFERPILAQEMPVSETVGMDVKLKKLMDWIIEENWGIIGLYGMGGSGKTTLMKKLHNTVIADINIRRDFALVIWIDLAGGCDEDQIMNDLREKCKIDDENWGARSRDEKAGKIFKDLKGKKYILFVDGACQAIRLPRIGLPPPKANGSKILIATRFENVCDQMNAKKFKVHCLGESEALDLLCSSAGHETINSESESDLRMVAHELSQECEGLPLALVAVGGAMASQNNPQSWEHILQNLKNSTSTVEGMEQEVFTTLMSSYDSLPTTIEKHCFLYCALFPKGQIIFVHDLIRLWIGEGLLGNDHSLQRAFNHGAYVVGRLKVASLLEDCGDNSVKMHNVIRNMALWLARDEDQRRDKVLVQDEALGSSRDSGDEKWLTVEKISSVSDSHNEEVLDWHVPISPNIETLILRCNVHVKYFENVRFMTKLKVLSLRRIEGIITLPKEIGQLIDLEYLDLSYLNIKEKLPIEMNNLTRLRVFLLEHVHFSLEIISKEVISCLKSLMVFSFWRKRSSETTNDPPSLTSFTSPFLQEESFLERLEGLPLLQDISLTLETTSGINKLLSSTKLRRHIRSVGLIHQQHEEINAAINAPIILSVAKMEHLEAIHLVAWQDGLGCSALHNGIDIFWQLSEVQIVDCDYIADLTWLRFAPLLRSLEVVGCGFLKEVMKEIEEDVDHRVFKKLDSIVLTRLPKLESIYKKALPFPKLTVMEIIGCPKLKKLPLDRNSATNTLKRIRGETQWWDDLEWQDPMAKEIFQAKFTGETSSS